MALTAVFGVLVGCVAPDGEPPDRLVPELADAVDVDPSPDTVELHLEAVVSELPVGDGPPVEVWAYRDLSIDGPPTIPGPLLRVSEGQQLRVHLHNALDVSTTLHLHGVALPNAMDGSEVTQMLVRPGEEHHHEFVVTHPGTFWYHPHQEVADQVARGLYGPGVSAGDTDLAETADRMFVLVDVVVDDADEPVYDVDPEVWRVGRQGNLLLVNGAVAGEDLVVEATARERWRFLNAAHSRTFALRLDGQELLVVGGDAGPVRRTWRTDRLLVAPGDRFEVVVEPEPGTRSVLWSEPYDRGFDLATEEPVPLFTVVGPRAANTGLPAVPAERDGMPRVPLPAGATVRELALAATTAPNGEPLFTIDDMAWPFSDPVSVRLGDVETWVVRNCTDGDQPFHVHGLFFDVLDGGGSTPDHDSREDVATVPPHGELRLAVPFDQPGSWMFHTHLLDQGSHGMMGVLSVGDASPSPSAEVGCP